MYKLHLVAFFDILGFKEIIEEKRFEQVNSLYEDFGRMIDVINTPVPDGITSSKQFEFAKEKLSLIYFSDCIVWAYPMEAIAKSDYWDAVISLITKVNSFYLLSFGRSVLIRGGITIEDLFINGNKVFGKGLVRAYELEQMAEFPQVVLSPSILLNKIQPPNDVQSGLIRTLISDDAAKRFFSIDYFKYVSQVCRLAKEGDLHARVAIPNYVDPLIKLIQRGIKHPNERVRSKYQWLRSGLLSIKDLDYNLSSIRLN